MMAMNKTASLAELLAGLVDSSMLTASGNITVDAIAMDSRKVSAGGLFLSLAKTLPLRFNYLQQALNLGAKVVIYDAGLALSEAEVDALNQANVLVLPAENLSENVGEIAARFYGKPSLEITVIAVTGTNGKTSVSQFIAQALESLGIACGVIGTLGIGRIDNLLSTGMTTPDPVNLQAVLADLRDQSVKYVVIEASSHALEQGRLNSVEIDVAVLTNLSRDHLDYHNSMTEYAAAKQRLFAFTSLKAVVVNVADAFGKQLLSTLPKTGLQIHTYSSDELASDINNHHWQANSIKASPQGIQFDLKSHLGNDSIQTKLLGRFNVDNILAAIATITIIGISFDDAIKSMANCEPVNGRMQVYGDSEQTHVVVDFAHTPDALAQALLSLKAHLSDGGHLWCVFGCGGDRDTGKRPLMGRTAETYADKVVLTDDNPRSESNLAIVEEILAGIENPQNIHVEHNRQKAIDYAVVNAQPIDIVLVAGKGHEQYQEIAGIKYPFSDAQAVMNSLQAANDANNSLVEINQ